MPKQLDDIKDFLVQCRREDAKEVKIMRLKDGKTTKFKIRCSRFMYTLSVDDEEKLKKLIMSLPPGVDKIMLGRGSQKI
jgi:large subunit ribosomal protein L38e